MCGHVHSVRELQAIFLLKDEWSWNTVNLLHKQALKLYSETWFRPQMWWAFPVKNCVKQMPVATVMWGCLPKQPSYQGKEGGNTGGGRETRDPYHKRFFPRNVTQEMRMSTELGSGVTSEHTSVVTRSFENAMIWWEGCKLWEIPRA